MNQSQLICLNSPSYWDQNFAREMADKCTKLCGLTFRVYKCRFCPKHHLTVKAERVMP